MKTQNFPLVSIIIPTYNNSSVVCQAIECALNQTYENREIIVIDDGSTDHTGEMLEEHYKGRIIYIRQDNKGTGSARNKGISYASGKYLQFLDADDLLDPDKIRIQVSSLKGIRDKALSYCDYARCDVDDITVTYRRTSPVLQNENPFDDILTKWETEISIPSHCFIFDAAFFKECGIAFDETLRANEDWECWMNVFAFNPRVVYIDKVLAYYRVRKNSRCSNRLDMRKSYLMAIDKQIQKHHLNKEIVRKLALRRKQVQKSFRDVAPVKMFVRDMLRRSIWGTKLLDTRRKILHRKVKDIST